MDHNTCTCWSAPSPTIHICSKLHFRQWETWHFVVYTKVKQGCRSLPGATLYVHSAFAFDISLPFQLEDSVGLYTIICPSLRIAKATKSYTLFVHSGGHQRMDVLVRNVKYAAAINPCPMHVCQRRICLSTQKQMRTFIYRVRKIRIYTALQVWSRNMQVNEVSLSLLYSSSCLFLVSIPSHEIIFMFFFLVLLRFLLQVLHR
jgi:hypothetical protein